MAQIALLLLLEAWRHKSPAMYTMSPTKPHNIQPRQLQPEASRRSIHQTIKQASKKPREDAVGNNHGISDARGIHWCHSRRDSQTLSVSPPLPQSALTPHAQANGGNVGSEGGRAIIVQQSHKCRQAGWYCFQNGQDWASCNLELGRVTNDQFRVVHAVHRCEPGAFMGPF